MWILYHIELFSQVFFYIRVRCARVHREQLKHYVPALDTVIIEWSSRHGCPVPP